MIVEEPDCGSRSAGHKIHRQRSYLVPKGKRTSDSGNGNHKVSLPILLIKIKVGKMLPSSYRSSLSVSILQYCLKFPISVNVRFYQWAKMVIFV